MADAVFWWTGVTVWVAIGALLAWGTTEWLIGFACAVSWCRWSYQMAAAAGARLKWRGLPQTFLRRWWEFTGYRNNGNTEWAGEHGYWRGIGDWQVKPNAELSGAPTEET